MKFVEIAYYPGETPQFDGEVTLTEQTEPDESAATRVSVNDNPLLDVMIRSVVERPIRTQYNGYFLRDSRLLMVTCNVDLELNPQPTTEDIARAILAAHSVE